MAWRHRVMVARQILVCVCVVVLLTVDDSLSKTPTRVGHSNIRGSAESHKSTSW